MTKAGPGSSPGPALSVGRRGTGELMRSALRLPVSGAILVLSLCLAAQKRAEAQDAKAGREKAEAVCAVCHGVDGLSKIAEAPNLAGQTEAYLIEQLTAFKSGDRKNEMMSVVVQDLSSTDIENLAAYYSAIEISVGKIPGQ
jgi:cytochrome c553